MVKTCKIKFENDKALEQAAEMAQMYFQVAVGFDTLTVTLEDPSELHDIMALFGASAVPAWEDL